MEVTDGVDYWCDLMIFFGAALVAVGLSVAMLAYAIVGGILVLAGIFLLVSFRRSRGNRPPLR
jgi:hypothetical protein